MPAERRQDARWFWAALADRCCRPRAWRSRPEQLKTTGVSDEISPAESYALSVSLLNIGQPSSGAAHWCAGPDRRRAIQRGVVTRTPLSDHLGLVFAGDNARAELHRPGRHQRGQAGPEGGASHGRDSRAMLE